MAVGDEWRRVPSEATVMYPKFIITGPEHSPLDQLYRANFAFQAGAHDDTMIRATSDQVMEQRQEFRPIDAHLSREIDRLVSSRDSARVIHVIGRSASWTPLPLSTSSRSRLGLCCTKNFPHITIDTTKLIIGVIRTIRFIKELLCAIPSVIGSRANDPTIGIDNESSFPADLKRQGALHQACQDSIIEGSMKTVEHSPLMC